MKNLARTLTVGALLLGLATPLQAAVYTADTSHSTVGFSVRHLMITNVRGEFTDFTATVNWDPANLDAFSVEAVIKAASINTQNQRRDDHLRNPDFFDVEKFPELRFVSKKVARDGAGLKVTGDLTMHGVTREVVLSVEGPTPPITDPWGNERIGVSATTKINRTDYGLTWNRALEAGGVTVGEEVTINLDLSLVKQK